MPFISGDDRAKDQIRFGGGTRGTFHVKHLGQEQSAISSPICDKEMNINTLLTDAKILKQRIENIINIHAPQQPSHQLNRNSKLLRHKFIAPSD